MTATVYIAQQAPQWSDKAIRAAEWGSRHTQISWGSSAQWQLRTASQCPACFY